MNATTIPALTDSVLSTLTMTSKEGDRVEVNGKPGTVQSMEYAFAFNGAYFVVKMDDGTTRRILMA